MSGNSETRDDGRAGQRRQVTVLFADMVGYTALSEQLGEEQTYLLMQRVHRALNEAVHAQEGTVQEMTGDGVMALFGAPVAIEDAPLHACRSALDIQARMAALAGEIESEHGARPGFRVGIHSGPLVVGEVGDERKSGVTALGDTVNLASRIESEAETGEIMLSEATHALVEGFVEAEFAGARAIKGTAEMYAKKGNHIITTVTEHKAVLDTVKHLESQGFEITWFLRRGRLVVRTAG